MTTCCANVNRAGRRRRHCRWGRRLPHRRPALLEALLGLCVVFTRPQVHGQYAGYIWPQEQHALVYQVRYVPHFTPLDGACMSKRAATFDMQRISAAMTGGKRRKRRPNLTWARFAESEQQVYRLILSISPCRRRHRKEAPVVFRPSTPYMYAGSGNAN